MSTKYRNLAGQILLVLNIFIVFILLFESYLVLPAWIQSIGRLHPLLLHFPIVLLLLALLLGLFPTTTSKDSFHPFLITAKNDLLLLGAITAGVTVIMGVFLSSEEGYSGEVLFWHKWSGAGAFFIVSLVYLFHRFSWFQGIISKVLMVFSGITIIAAGHYGSILTHGDNFIWEPLMAADGAPKVALEDALVYQDIIQPILDQKCVGCHNEDKLKGELMLTDMNAILKGGKSGKLFVAGNPEISLILERIHLPLEEKKHMPPSGKVQLTKEEEKVLAAWIKANADFKLKVVDLSEKDTLRMLATLFLTPEASAEEPLDFRAADPDVILKLNNDYRTVAEFARNSPALSVNIYNKNQYTAAQLSELEPINKQIIALNLNKLPVKDADLDIIAKFENLRKLDLNFTDITASGLSKIQKLPHLKEITLSGTKMEMAALLKVLPNFKALKTITLWDTGLQEKDFDKLTAQLKSLNIISGFRDDGTSPLQLNQPQVKNASMVFNKTMNVQLFHPIRGTEIRYTTDGTEPDSIDSPIFTSLRIDKNTFIKAKAFKKGWYGSETIAFDFLKNAYTPDSLRLAYVLNRVHKAAGANTFFDGKLGAIGANNPAWANFWAGVRDTDMELYAEFKAPVSIATVGVHYMVEENTGIFPPDVVEVWAGTEPNQWKLINKFKPQKTVKGETPSIRLAEGTFNPVTVKYLKIIAKPVTSIPEWHRSKGGKALLLVDEMFLN